MSTTRSQGLLSPATDEVFSTPPTTPGPQLEQEQINKTISRRSSRPTSLHIDHLQKVEWNPNLVLDTSSPVITTNGPHISVSHSDSIVPNPSSSTHHHRSRSHMIAQTISSPCFVHSHLDKGASLTDWLKTRSGANQPAISDLGVARSLQHSAAPNRSPFSENKPNHHQSSAAESDEDEFVGSLTKQLAETAVGVREMSKQLGGLAHQWSLI